MSIERICRCDICGKQFKDGGIGIEPLGGITDQIVYITERNWVDHVDMCNNCILKQEDLMYNFLAPIFKDTV